MTKLKSLVNERLSGKKSGEGGGGKKGVSENIDKDFTHSITFCALEIRTDLLDTAVVGSTDNCGGVQHPLLGAPADGIPPI